MAHGCAACATVLGSGKEVRGWSSGSRLQERWHTQQQQQGWLLVQRWQQEFEQWQQ